MSKKKQQKHKTVVFTREVYKLPHYKLNKDSHKIWEDTWSCIVTNASGFSDMVETEEFKDTSGKYLNVSVGDLISTPNISGKVTSVIHSEDKIQMRLNSDIYKMHVSHLHSLIDNLNKDIANHKENIERQYEVFKERLEERLESKHSPKKKWWKR